MQASWPLIPPSNVVPPPQTLPPKDDLLLSLRSSLESLREVLFRSLPPPSLSRFAPPVFLSFSPFPRLEDLFISHPYIALDGNTFDSPQRKFHSSVPDDFLKPEFAPAKRMAELQDKQQQVLAALRRCHRVTDKYLKDKREPAWVVNQLQRITAELNMDFDASQAIVFGTRGANTGFCFMAEISLGPHPSLVQTAAVTYLVGNPDDLPGPSPEASEELRALIMKGDMQLLEQKLGRIRDLENLLVRYPEASLHLSLGLVEQTFSQLIHTSPEMSVGRLLEGPSLAYYQLPLDRAKPHRLTFLGPVETLGEGGHLSFPFQFELQPPLGMEVASLIRLTTEVLGMPLCVPRAEDPSAQQTASFHRLLSVCDEEGSFHVPAQLPGPSQPLFITMPDGFQQTWVVGGQGMLQRGALVSRVTMHSLDNLPMLLKMLKQQILFNHLYRSVFGSSSGPSEDSKGFELHADPPTQLRVFTPTFTLVIMTAEVQARLEPVGDHKLPCSNDYATRVLQTCLSVPLTVRFICQKVAS